MLTQRGDGAVGEIADGLATDAEDLAGLIRRQVEVVPEHDSSSLAIWEVLKGSLNCKGVDSISLRLVRWTVPLHRSAFCGPPTEVRVREVGSYAECPTCRRLHEPDARPAIARTNEGILSELLRKAGIARVVGERRDEAGPHLPAEALEVRLHVTPAVATS